MEVDDAENQNRDKMDKMNESNIADTLENENDELPSNRLSMLIASDSYDDVAEFLKPGHNHNIINNDHLLNLKHSSSLPSLFATSTTAAMSSTNSQYQSNKIGSLSLDDPVIYEDNLYTYKRDRCPDNSTLDSHSTKDRDESTSTTTTTTATSTSTTTASTTIIESHDHDKPDTDTILTVHCSATSSGSEDDRVVQEKWAKHKKHVFILSEAGKPIYTRYGDADSLVTLMGVMQALVSFIQHAHQGQDTLRCICTEEHRFVFLVRDHLILVMVSQVEESTLEMIHQLIYIYNQIISILTLSQVKRIFRQRQNYDLRRLLGGADKLINNLLYTMENDPSFFFNAVRCLPLDPTVRETIEQTLVHYCKVKDLVFAILLSGHQLIALARLKKYFLNPSDLHLLFNLVCSSDVFKSADSWTPVCLPKFDSTGFLYSHISYVDDKSRVCLLLLTVDPNIFFTLYECRQKIQQRLLKHNCLKAVDDYYLKGDYTMDDVGVSEIRHFIYKCKNQAQYTSPVYSTPYSSKQQQQRLLQLYQHLHNRIHNPARQLNILYYSGAYEAVLGWVTSGFELYAVFSASTNKSLAITCVNRLLRWIKREEHRLFILNAPTI